MRTITALGFTLCLTSCTLIGPSLEGDWEGEIDCSDGSTEIVLELERDEGNVYVGDGELRNYGCQGCELRFDIEIEADGGFGEQDLDIDLDDCTYADQSGTFVIPCSFDFDDVVWDGKDNIEFEVDACDGELDRD